MKPLPKAKLRSAAADAGKRVRCFAGRLRSKRSVGLPCAHFAMPDMRGNARKFRLRVPHFPCCAAAGALPELGKFRCASRSGLRRLREFAAKVK